MATVLKGYTYGAAYVYQAEDRTGSIEEGKCANLIVLDQNLFTIDPEKISEVIGKQGKTINGIIDETGVKIDIDESGRIDILSEDQAMIDKAISIIKSIVEPLNVGDIYEGEVVRIMNFGAFVQLSPNKDGMIHISKLSNERVEKVEDVVNIGDKVAVKVLEIDKMGRINLKLEEKIED